MAATPTEKQRDAVTAFVTSYAQQWSNLGSTADPVQASLTDDQRQHGSYGTVKTLASTKFDDINSVKDAAAAGGWADPTIFDPGMLIDVQQSYTGGGDGGQDPSAVGSARFKDEFANARGITNTGRNQNQVQVLYAPNENGNHYGSNISGYVVKAGSVAGMKNHTDVLYQYDKNGKFVGANLDVKEKGLQGAAPLLAMVAMALTAGGAGSIAAGWGGSLNAQLGLGLGQVGQTALGNAAVGLGQGAILGQNPLPGMVMSQLNSYVSGKLGGAVNSAIEGASPAVQMGTKALAGGAMSKARGGDFLTGAMSTLGPSGGAVANVLKMIASTKSKNNASQQAAASRKAYEDFITNWARPIKR